MPDLQERWGGRGRERESMMRDERCTVKDTRPHEGRMKGRGEDGCYVLRSNGRGWRRVSGC